MGDPKELKAVLEDASKSTTLSAEDRFWAIDALTFWDTQDRLYENIPDRVKIMQALAKEAELSVKARTAIAMKCMIQAGFANDVEGIEDSFRQAMPLAGEDKSLSRIIRYNHAYALFHAQGYLDAKTEVESLIDEYHVHLKLRTTDVLLKSLNHTAAIVSRVPTWRDDVKHLADCLDILSSIKKKLNLHLGLEQIHALKFYIITDAYNSAIRVGQNAVDQLVGIGAYEEARKTIENSLLPLIRMARLVQYEIQVRSQYAVVLAYCGEIAAARSEMKRLNAYDVSQQQKNEIRNQSHIIEALANGYLKIESVAAKSGQPAAQADKKVQRNDPCPCGSGLKYKKCHGG
jgi:hypothetical protein